LNRGDSWHCGNINVAVTVLAGDHVIAGMNLMAEKDGLRRAFYPAFSRIKVKHD